MVGDERPGGGAGGRLLQDRRLDLEEVVVVEEPADPLDRLRPGPEPRPGLVVDQQVEIAAAVAGLHVRQALPFVRQRARRPVEHGEIGYRYRPLTTTGGVETAGDPDEVADLQRAGPLPDGVRAQLIPGQGDLDTPAAVLDVPEDQTTHPTPEHHSAGEADRGAVRRLPGAGGHRVGAITGPGPAHPGLLR